ncbi:unnamed protein product, partial [Prunus brigantina]
LACTGAASSPSLRSLSRKSKLHLCPQIGIWASHLCPRRDATASGEEIERQRCFEGKKVSVQKTRPKLTSPTSSATSLALSSTVASETRSHIQFHSCFLSFVEKNSSYYAKLFIAVFGG